MKPLLTLCTRHIHDGVFRTDWQTARRHGYVFTRPPACAHRRAVAELLALHAATGLQFALTIREFRIGGSIRVTAPEIPELLGGATQVGYLRPYARFISLTLNDLHVELMRIEDWRESTHPEPPEGMTLVNHEPWEDVLRLGSAGRFAPTRRAIDQVREHMQTRSDWKVWARLRDNADFLHELPADNGVSASPRLVCANDGWIMVVADQRIVDVRSPFVVEVGVVTRMLSSVPSIDESKMVRPALFALGKTAEYMVRVRILRECLDALPPRVRRIRAEDGRAIGKTAIGALVDAALAPIADPAKRAYLLRMVTDLLPDEEARVTLPDGSRAFVAGHALDRLVTRFNVKSPLDGLALLHAESRKFYKRELPAEIVAAKRLAHAEPAVHWRHPKGWTLVVANDTVATVYFQNHEHYIGGGRIRFGS